MKWQFVLIHIICQTESPTLLDSWVTDIPSVITCTQNFDCTYFMIYLKTVIGLSPSGSSTVHIHTQTIHRTTQ